MLKDIKEKEQETLYKSYHNAFKRNLCFLLKYVDMDNVLFELFVNNKISEEDRERSRSEFLTHCLYSSNTIDAFLHTLHQVKQEYIADYLERTAVHPDFTIEDEVGKLMMATESEEELRIMTNKLYNLNNHSFQILCSQLVEEGLLFDREERQFVLVCVNTIDGDKKTALAVTKLIKKQGPEAGTRFLNIMKNNFQIINPRPNLIYKPDNYNS